MSPLLLLLVLAVIQGLSEFLPISSSGHLVLAETLLPGGEQLPKGVGIEILLHLGTLAAVVFHYRERISLLITGVFQKSGEGTHQRHYFLKLLVATVPAVIAGVFIFDTNGNFFSSTTVVAGGLLITAIVLFSSMFAKSSSGEITYLNAFLIGVAQAFAIVPGISRSGSTIIAARHLKIPPQEAENFSFLIAIPAILGAAILKLPELDIKQGLGLSAVEIALTLMLSCVVGLIALRLLHSVLQQRKLYIFAPYCLVVAVLVLTRV
jgi:undecaprenyl-diphosphatase